MSFVEENKCNNDGCCSHLNDSNPCMQAMAGRQAMVEWAVDKLEFGYQSLHNDQEECNYALLLLIELSRRLEAKINELGDMSKRMDALEAKFSHLGT